MSEGMDVMQADHEHYQIEFENEQVRVLRIRFEPGGRSEMHSHPPSTLVFLTDGEVRFHLPAGTHRDVSFQAGQTLWVPATTHLPENRSDRAFELLQIEMKPGR